MEMRENTGTHHELTYLYEAVFTLLQNREYLLSVMLLSSYFLSCNDVGHCTAFFNISVSLFKLGHITCYVENMVTAK